MNGLMTTNIQICKTNIMNIIKKFIKENKLEFDDSGSSLNGNCAIISGFSLYNGINTIDQLIDLMPELNNKGTKELSQVFKYAQTHNYGAWWEDRTNNNQYKF